MTGSAQPKSPQPVTNEVLSLQVAHLQQGFDEERARTQEERTEIRALLSEHTTRLRSVEDDRIRAWTVISVVFMFGVPGWAAILKWLLTN